jgi:hypothetical protein
MLRTVQEKLQTVQAQIAEMQRGSRDVPAHERLRLKRLKAAMPSLEANMAEARANYEDFAKHSAFESVHECGKLFRHAGAVLCSLLPTCSCCNNPRCSSMATASEGFLLVRGPSCVCGGCLMGSRRPALAPTFCTAAR